jgi:hypothetical protein
MSVSIRFLHALHGDCILITIGSEEPLKRILIDGGPPGTFKARPSGDLRAVLAELLEQGKYIDLVILTHVDDDHIGGLIKAFEYEDGLALLAKKVIFNSGRLIHEYFNVAPDLSKEIEGNFNQSQSTSIGQGNTLERLLENKGIWHQEIIKQGDTYLLDGAELLFLSPNEAELNRLLGEWVKEFPIQFTSHKKTDWGDSYEKLLSADTFVEDDSDTNASSLAFVLKVDGRNYLFLGDAHPTTVSMGLKLFKYTVETPLEAELVKVSHHGSKGNTNSELLQLVDCSRFVISTDGSRHGLPDKVTLARIHKHNSDAVIYFNYEVLIGELYSGPELEALGSKIQAANGELKFA